MPCYSINDVAPVVHASAYVHETVVLIGDVIIGPRCYVGPCASLRGDFGRIEMREGSNVQDTCVMHAFPGKDCIVDVDGHVGHGAVLHGCVVGRNALIGMNAVVMDDAKIAEECIVAAGAFVKANFTCEPRSLIVGSPAKVLKTLTDDEVQWKSLGTREYQELAVRSFETMREVEPLREVPADRPRVYESDFEPKSTNKSSGPKI